MSLGPHAIFIWLCYAAVALVVGGLIAWLHADGQRLGRALAELEAKSGRRTRGGPEANVDGQG